MTSSELRFSSEITEEAWPSNDSLVLAFALRMVHGRVSITSKGILKGSPEDINRAVEVGLEVTQALKASAALGQRTSRGRGSKLAFMQFRAMSALYQVPKRTVQRKLVSKE